MLWFVVNIPLTIVPDDEVPDGGDVLVDGIIAGHPYRFRLDSGAARTELVTDDYLSALPAAGQHVSAGVFGQQESSDVITIPGMQAGELSTGPVEVVRVAAGAGRQHLIGMDLLVQYCCEFRFAGRLLVLSAASPRTGLDVRLDRGNHVYLDLEWDGVTVRACWDSGAGISAVDQAFAAAHPGLFTPAGESTGTDSTTTQASAPLMTMAGPVIGGVQFAPSTVAVIDLGPVNAGLEIPLTVIAGYPLLRQADWLFDFPARRLAAPRLLAR